jgi:hypothetical protein
LSHPTHWILAIALMGCATTPVPLPEPPAETTTKVIETPDAGPDPSDAVPPVDPPPIDHTLLAPMDDDWDPWEAWGERQAAVPADVISPSQFMHVVHAGGPIAIGGAASWPVSPDAPSESRWAALLLRYGETEVHKVSPHAVVLVTRLRPGAVPRAIGRLNGKRLQTYTADGALCTGTAAEAVEVLYLDHELYDAPQGEPFDPWDELGSALSISEYLRTQGNNRYIGFRLRSPEPCDDAVWARKAASKPPRFGTVGPASKEETDRATAELLDSEPSRYARALFDREGWGHWLDVEEYNLRRGSSRHLDATTEPIVVRTVTTADARWVMATARGGHHYCSSPSTTLFRAWTQETWVSVSAPSPGSGVVPTVVVDVDGDGEWEFLEHGPGGASLSTLRDGVLIQRTVPVTPHFWVSC